MKDIVLVEAPQPSGWWKHKWGFDRVKNNKDYN